MTATPNSARQRKGAKFWLIFVSLCVSVFLSALDYTAVASALPVIINDLHGSEFAWIGTSYTLSSTAFLPMSGGIAQILGRKMSLILALLIFALGSALCGAAKSMSWLIAARTVQGVGGGAILSLSSIVVSDLVTLQERGAYNGLLGLTWAVAIAIGPLIGGVLAQSGAWRWLFYLNLPVCAVALTMVVLFMNLPTPKGTFKEKFFSMDWIGNALVISSSTSLVLALTWGGGRFAWTTPNVLVPLILGIVGLIAWFGYEMNFASHPMVSRELLGNRTTVSGYVQVFMSSVVVIAWVYYLPVYFQACKDARPTRSGVDMFGGTLNIGPFIVFGGASVSIFKVYRPQLWAAWVIALIGYGTLGILGATTPLSHAVGFSVIASAGCGIIFAVAYFPVLSPLPVSLNAHALALFAFIRCLAQIWGITFGSTILMNQLKMRLPAEFLDVTAGGIDLVYSLIPTIRDLPQPLKSQVQEAFAHSIRPIWYTMAGFCFLGLVTSLLMQDIPLHNYVDEQWTMPEELKKDMNVEVDVENVEE